MDALTLYNILYNYYAGIDNAPSQIAATQMPHTAGAKLLPNFTSVFAAVTAGIGGALNASPTGGTVDAWQKKASPPKQGQVGGPPPKYGSLRARMQHFTQGGAEGAGIGRAKARVTDVAVPGKANENSPGAAGRALGGQQHKGTGGVGGAEITALLGECSAIEAGQGVRPSVAGGNTSPNYLFHSKDGIEEVLNGETNAPVSPAAPFSFENLFGGGGGEDAARAALAAILAPPPGAFPVPFQAVLPGTAAGQGQGGHTSRPGSAAAPAVGGRNYSTKKIRGSAGKAPLALTRTTPTRRQPERTTPKQHQQQRAEIQPHVQPQRRQRNAPVVVQQQQAVAVQHVHPVHIADDRDVDTVVEGGDVGVDTEGADLEAALDDVASLMDKV